MNLIKRCLLAVLLAIPFAGNSQNYLITGKVVDTFNYTSIFKGSVTLIRASDSILMAFTRTKSDGSFELRADSAGSYFLNIAYPTFVDYIEKINVTGTGLNMGEIPVFTRSKLLNEFVLKQNMGSIKIKGDTTEYMADSFAVRENASVEELLKKLPGLTVDKNGQVTAQGEKVQKILVDGEEFFSDDPAVVTKSLQAKTVESVQVYDKKSDQAIFTGIDDGEKEKTINLKLKENSKRGYFGKVALGGGTDGFYENQGMINSFKGKRQLSAFAILSNTSNIGLGWEDARKYGASSDNNMEFNEDDGVMYSWNSGSDNYDGRGLPQVFTGGVHYANKWNDGKEHLSGNYRYSTQNVDGFGNTLTQYILPDSQYFSDQRSSSRTTNQRHRGDGLFEWTIDTTSTLKLTVNAGHQQSNSFASNNTRTFSDTTDINRSNRTTTGDTKTNDHGATLTYRKRFKKKGRTISADLKENYTDVDGVSQLFAAQQYFAAGIPVDYDTTNQRKTNNSTKLSVSGNASYTEPLSKKIFLELRYGLNLQNNQSKLLSYNTMNGGENFTDLDSAFSSNYDYDYITNTGGASIRFAGKKLKFSFGGSMAHTEFDQRDLLRNSTFSRSFNNFFPRANLNYEIAKMQTIRFGYNGSTNQPSIFQIQPLQQNTDPLNITVGNPNLRQEFVHNFNLGFNSYKVLTETYVYMGGGFNMVDDDISRTTTIDGVGRSVSQYVNVDGNYNGYLYGGMGSKIKKLNLRYGFNTNINVGRSNNFVNGLKNISNNNTYGLSLRFNYELDKKVDLYYNPGITYNQNKSSISSLATSFYTINHEFGGTVQLPFKFEANSTVDWNIRERTGQFDRNNSVFLWNAYITRKFLKGDQLEVRASAYDILNQNIGFQRMGSVNTVTQQSYNTIRRYAMFSVIWNFTHTGKGATAPAAESDVLMLGE